MSRGVLEAKVSPSVQMQFVLAEFLTSFEEAAVIQSALTKLAKQSAPVLPGKRQPLLQQQISDALEQLAPPSDDRLVDHPWLRPQGALSRLRLYASGLTHGQLFARAVDKAWLHARSGNASRFLDAMESIGSQLPALLRAFQADENVLFFIAKHHQKFDEIYGKRSVHKMFTAFHPQGVKGVQTLLLKRYRERGFAFLAEPIAEAMNAIGQGKLCQK